MLAPRQTFRVAVRQFPPFESAIRKQWAAFERQERTGLALQAEPLELEPLRRAVREGACDVAFLCTDWISEADEAGILVDLAPYLGQGPPEGFPKAWSDSLLRLQCCDGRVLGLPYHDGPECLIYRRDLFESAALDPPRTWDQFHARARLLTRPEAPLYGTALAALPDGHNTVYDFCLQLWTRGGELFDHTGRLSLDGPQAITAVQFYRDLLTDSTATHPRCREFDSVGLGRAFAAGELAMMVNWFGFASLPQTLAESPARGNVAVAPIPSAGGQSASLNVYWLLAISAASAQRDLAWRFLRHCASPAMDKLLALEGGIGCRQSTWFDTEVNVAIPFYHSLARLHENARELPRLADWPRLAAIIDAMLLEGINTGEPAAAICARAQARAAALLAQRDPVL